MQKRVCAEVLPGSVVRGAGGCRSIGWAQDAAQPTLRFLRGFVEVSWGTLPTRTFPSDTASNFSLSASYTSPRGVALENPVKRLAFPDSAGQNSSSSKKNNLVVFMPDGYSSAAARSIVGISQRRLDYWAELDVVCPSIKQAAGKGTERRYSFDDLLSLALVKKLREAGLSLQKIRNGLGRLRKRKSSSDPLREEILVTDGKKLFRQVNSGELEDILAGGQLVFSVVALGKIRGQINADLARLPQRLSSGEKPARSRTG